MLMELLAPAEGTASDPKAIADELCEALTAIERVDYDALTVDSGRYSTRGTPSSRLPTPTGGCTSLTGAGRTLEVRRRDRPDDR